MTIAKQFHAASQAEAARLGQELLHEALREVANIQKCIALIEAGADLEQKDKNGGTALIRAIAGKKSGLADILLQAGADPSTEAANGISALTWCVISNMDKTIKTVIAAGAKIDAFDHDGDTALHYAVDHKNVLFTEILTESGADPFIENKKGKTPLILAEDLSLEYKNRDRLIEILQGAEEKAVAKKHLAKALTAIDRAAHAGAGVAQTTAPIPAFKKEPFPKPQQKSTP